MKYKLLVLDVDGTLLNNQKEISPSYPGCPSEGTANGGTYRIGIRKTD